MKNFHLDNKDVSDSRKCGTSGNYDKMDQSSSEDDYIQSTHKKRFIKDDSIRKGKKIKKNKQDASTDVDTSKKLKHEKKKINKNKGKKKHKKKSVSTDSSSNSDSSSSDSRKKSKKIKKSIKKRKKKKKKKVDEVLKGVATNTYGKYGRIEECDLWGKRQEFQLWLLDTKNVNLEELSSWEEKNHFKTYVEDYNTATLPHQKYYNLAKWEMDCQEKYNSNPLSDRTEMSNFNDEARRKQEIKELRARRNVIALKGEYFLMKSDADKVESMRKQKLLRTQMDTLFKMGRFEEAQKLQDILKPD